MALNSSPSFHLGEDHANAFDRYSKDVFMDIIKGLAADGLEIAALDNSLVFPPTLTIDTSNHFREQEFNIFGDGDTC